MTSQISNDFKRLENFADSLEEELRMMEEEHPNFINIRRTDLKLLNRARLIVICKDFDIDGTDSMSNDEMIDALRKIPKPKIGIEWDFGYKLWERTIPYTLGGEKISQQELKTLIKMYNRYFYDF